jgi:hypothetical protein
VQVLHLLTPITKRLHYFYANEALNVLPKLGFNEIRKKAGIQYPI